MSNHLFGEHSSYLQRHASSLVDWYPWGEEAFAKARQENKALFVFIGYSACHGCQVMEQESFNAHLTATLLNTHFISIKVDKEERSDIAHYFQKVYQLTNQRPTAWPLCLFLTDEAKPFYATAYIPHEPRYEMMSFSSLLEVTADKYRNEKALLTEKAEEILHFLNPKENAIQATKLDLSIIGRVTEQAKQLFDAQHGGFTQIPKFPQTSLLDLLLDVYEINQEEETLHLALFSLRKMAEANIRDLSEGGFYAYCNDTQWLNPHPVKNTYDNALLSSVYLKAYRVSGDIFYKTVACEIIDFMLQQMSESSLFYASMSTEVDLPARLDKTILASYNAMMIQTLFKASRLEPTYLEPAITSLDVLLELAYIHSELYHVTLLAQTPKTKAFLEDYAYLSEALIEAYECTLDERYLVMATKLVNAAIEKFYVQGTWKYTRGTFEADAEVHDAPYNSPVSTMLSALQRIGSLVDAVYQKFIFKTLERYSYDVMRQPISSPQMTSMVIRYLKDDSIIQR